MVTMAAPIELTPRQREILLLMAQRGLSDVAIAERLGITVNTVKTHVQHVLDANPQIQRTRGSRYWLTRVAYLLGREDRLSG